MRILRLIPAAVVLLGTCLVAPPAVAAQQAAPTWAARTYSGNTDDVFRVPATTKAGIAKIAYEGEGHFAVWALKPNGKKDNLLANTLDAYAGTVDHQVPPLVESPLLGNHQQGPH